jgi:hypothetical protein
MKRILAAGILYVVASAPAFAAYTPLYAGFQLDNESGTALLGYQINKTYAVELFATRSKTSIDQAGATSDTKITEAGMAALFMFPMKLSGGSPYFLFAKTGYARISKKVTYSFPPSVTYSGSYSNTENQAIFGGGAQYDFYPSLNGRVGVDIVDRDRSVYLGIIFRF